METPEYLLSQAIVKLLRTESFYAHILANVSRVIETDVKTMAVSFKNDSFYLYVNPHFISVQLNEQQRVAVLKHEVLHLLFKHLFRGKGLDIFLENIAADLVVNQYVTPWPLPEGAVLLSTFPDLNLMPFETMEYYYNELQKLLKREARLNYEQSYHALENLRNQSGLIGEHDLWSKSSDVEVQGRVLSRILSAARKKSKDFSNLHDDIRNNIDLILKGSEVSWRNILRIFSSACGRTVLVSTRRKESKRFEGNPGRRIKRLKKIVVAIDTSGSISDELFSFFWSEIQAILKTGTKVIIVECDAKIQNTYELNRTHIKSIFKGGGGTDFDPVIKWINQERGVNGLIYFTDAYGPMTIRCKYPVLWCVYGENMDISHLKGRVIRLGN